MDNNSSDLNCLICFDEASDICPFMESNPCKCKGSMKIHQHCFERIRTHDMYQGKCPTCGTVLNKEPNLGPEFEADRSGLTYTRYMNKPHKKWYNKIKHGYTFTYVLVNDQKKLFAYELFQNNLSCGKIEIVFPGKEKEINLKIPAIIPGLEGRLESL